MEFRRKRLISLVVACSLLGVGAGGCYELLARMRDEARLASCRPFSIYQPASRYAMDHDGLFMPLSPVAGRLILDTELCPGYCWNSTDFICDSDEGAREAVADGYNEFDHSLMDDWSYVYLGYFIENERQAGAFFEKYREIIAEGGTFEDDLYVGEGNGNCGGDTLYRLRSMDSLPPELDCLRDVAHRIPVVIEWPGNHRRMGGNVVYLGGHTEYVRYPGPFPMTENIINGLHEIDALGEGHREPRP